MSDKPTNIPQATLLAIVAKAEREGRYNPAAPRLCDRCREWSDEILHVTFDGNRVCRGCCREIGVALPDEIQIGSTAAGQSPAKGGAHEVTKNTRKKALPA